MNIESKLEPNQPRRKETSNVDQTLSTHQKNPLPQWPHCHWLTALQCSASCLPLVSSPSYLGGLGSSKLINIYGGETLCYKREMYREMHETIS